MIEKALTDEGLYTDRHWQGIAMLYFGGTAGLQRVPSSYLENFDLPLPPKEKQLEIAHHVYQLRQRAMTLQEEGKLMLDEAKQEVEYMILNGDKYNNM